MQLPWRNGDFISGTATAMMMVPIATAIIYQVSKAEEDKNFNPAIMLSAAFAASIGGIATIIGTTQTLFLPAYTAFYSSEITSLQWAYFGFPLIPKLSFPEKISSFPNSKR